jgi:hypothetical protein
MKSNAALIWMLLLAITSAPRSALSQSATATVAGRVMGLPNENVANFELVFVSDTAVRRTANPYTGRWIVSLIIRSCGRLSRCLQRLFDGYGIRSMTAGGLDLLFNSVRLVASTQTEVLIEVARLEDLRLEKSSVLRVGDGLRSLCLMHKVEPVYPSQARAADPVRH